ncbi:3-dehydroquinate synthase [Candidatus Woesearchaeota archaeon]|nr:3-dehydroquinate synthase [Candidatus Woesearchaeota archaeon]
MHYDVNLKRNVDESYPILVVKSQQEIIDEISQLSYNKYALITDSNVQKLYGRTTLFSMGSVFSFEAGEQNKKIETVLSICEKMQGEGFGRDSLIIALGGGVVGDMAGFAASIYMRGIDYIQIPTTTLAIADSSVGGKTGVDTKYGKNLLGAFKQPIAVYVYPEFCKTLPETEYLNGMAETIKHGMIADASFCDYLEVNREMILKRDVDVLGKVALSNCKIKAGVVEKDPHEKGLRRILNYGHTIGHAIEHISKFKLSHGQAVSIGMAVEGKIACMLGNLEIKSLQRQNKLLSDYGLPIVIPDEFNIDDILEIIKLDKKSKNGLARFSLPCDIGRMSKFDGEWASSAEEPIIRGAISESLSRDGH